MPLQKKYLKSKPLCKVTFEFEAPQADAISVVGDFNNWTEEPMKKFKNGKFKTTLDLDANHSYEYKYVVDGTFVNDADADDYKFNSFAGNENSVIVL